MKILKQNLALVAILTIFNPLTYAQSDGFFEDVIVTAEKRNESLQDVSQAITALTSSEIEAKGIDSIVDLTSIVPGVTVAKNEGYKTYSDKNLKNKIDNNEEDIQLLKSIKQSYNQRMLNNKLQYEN